VPLISFHPRTETETVSETSCVVLTVFIAIMYSGCFMFIVCYFRFNVVLVWVSVRTHGFVICVRESVQVCCFMVGILFFGGF
jgi:hypothetical protein